MRTYFILLVILAQVLGLSWMALEREIIATNGTKVWLKTVPVDPRDLFRGDYVTLNYDLNNPSESIYGSGLKEEMKRLHTLGNDSHYNRKELIVYGTLKVDDAGRAEMTSLDLYPPSQGIFIKGRATYQGYSEGSISRISFGIDSFYVQQGTGGALERRIPEGSSESVPIPLEMQVAIGKDGTAVLLDYRWGELGLLIKTPDQTNQKDKVIDIVLHNPQNTPLTLVLPPSLSTFRLEALEWKNSVRVPVAEFGPKLDFTVGDLRTIKPKESITLKIDLSQPEWFIKHKPDSEPTAIGSEKHDEYNQFRIVYVSPNLDALKAAGISQKVWNGRVESLQFSSYQFNN